MSDYKPTEHNGLRQDGQPDQRVGTGEFAHGKVDPHEAGKKGGHTGTGSTSEGSDNSGSTGGTGQFAHGKVDPHEAGKKGGRTGTGATSEGSDNSGSTGGDYKPTEHGGMTKDGKPDGRVKGN